MSDMLSPPPTEPSLLTPPTDNFKYKFTVNTDASYSQAKHVAAWACWIRSDHHLIKASGLFPEPVNNSSLAELLAFEQAILRLEKLIAKSDYLTHYRERKRILLYVNTDNNWVIYILRKQIKRSKHMPVIRRIQKLVEDYELDIRHVKAHVDIKDSRTYVNDWCDRSAKYHLRRKVRQINVSKRRKYRRK